MGGWGGWAHAPVNMADSMEDVNVGGKNAGNGTFAALYCAVVRTPNFRKSTTCIFCNICHVPEKPRSGATHVNLLICFHCISTIT